MAIDEQFLKAAAELQEAVAALALRGVTVARNEAWDTSAIEYVRHLTSHLVHADQHFARREFELLAAFYGDGTTYHEEYELARHVALQSPHFFQRCPNFLAAALDEAPDVADRIRQSIRAMVKNLILVDGFASEREHVLARQYLQLDGIAAPMGQKSL